MTTIFALSSGAPPAGIGVIRVTGPDARASVRILAGKDPPPRKAVRRKFRSGEGKLLDDGLLLWFPAPASVTGEDVAEFHVHGGRAVIAAMEAELEKVPGLRRAEPGEFTRRSFINGRIDLAQAEGLADLLAAETELQRRAALALAGGQLSRKLEQWRTHLLSLSAQVEAVLDFEDEHDVAALPEEFTVELGRLKSEIAAALSMPSAETLREGYRVALAGPPNAGKSTLFNALTNSEAAIATPIAGTTRDVLVRSVAISGVPFSFVDMAGLHEEAADPVEQIGVERAREQIALADLVLWLGPEGAGPNGAWDIEPQCDVPGRTPKIRPDHRVSARTGQGIAQLVDALVAAGHRSMPAPGETAVRQYQRRRLAQAKVALEGVAGEADPLLLAERLRECRYAFDAVLGRTATEDVLDSLFGRFCIGK
jgi:tRNA modification GTPase